MPPHLTAEIFGVAEWVLAALVEENILPGPEARAAAGMPRSAERADAGRTSEANASAD
jgi:hypothetical protein